MYIWIFNIYAICFCYLLYGRNFFMGGGGGGGGQNQTGHCLHPCDLNWPEFYHGIEIMPSWLVYIEFHHGTKIMPFLNGIKIMPRWLFYYIYSISSWHYFDANFGVTYLHVTITLVLTKILCWTTAMIHISVPYWQLTCFGIENE